MNKNKSLKIIATLVIVLGLVTSIILVKKNQETRRGAASTQTTISVFQSTITGKVGETATVAINLYTPSRRVNVSQVKLCYGTALELDNGKQSINTSISKLNIKPLDPKIEDGCVTVYQSVDTGVIKSTEEYPTGAIQLMNITFKIKASGDLTIKQDFSIIAGDEDANGSANIPIDVVMGAKVKVIEGGVIPIESESSMKFESADLTSKKVGEVLSVNLFLTTDKKVDAADVKFCYGNKLSLEDSGIVIGLAFSQAPLKKIDGNCIRYTVISSGSNLLSGKILLGTFSFKAVSSGDGKLEFDSTIKDFTDSSSGQMTVGSAPSVNYTILPAVADCKTGDKQCVVINNKNIQQTCTSGNWGDNVNCDLGCDIATGKCVVINSAVGSSMTFESKDLTSKKVGETLGVDLYLTTNKNFDFCSVKFCYGDKLLLVDGGIVKGTEFTGIFKKTINSNCLEYAVLAVNKSLTGKVLLGTFNFKAVATGSGTLAFDSTIKNLFSKTYINKNELWTAENTPSVGYTILPTAVVCTPNNATQCVDVNGVGMLQTCTNGSWNTGVKCDSLLCLDDKKCYVCTEGDVICNSKGTGLETCQNNEYKISDDCSDLGCNDKTGECNKGDLVCTSFTYSGWTVCSEGNQTRTVVTSLPTGCTGGTPVLNQLCCTNEAKECVTASQARECVNNSWITNNCTSIQHCVDGACQVSSLTDAPVMIKMAFAGVKPGNDQCVTDWKIIGRLQGEEYKVQEGLIYVLTGGVPQKTAETNSKGEIIYNLSFIAPAIPASGIGNFSFFMKGPKHLSIKFGETAQSSWYGSLLGKLRIMPGVTNNYDFSNYPLLAGDVTGETVGVPDGKIDGRDYSYIKTKAVNLIAAAADGTDLDGDVNGDCQVNSGDVSLMVDSLKEINGQTY